MYNLDLIEAFGAASILVIFFVIIMFIGVILLYIFGALGLMELAKRNKVANPWLAFIPVGCNYLLGKLGFEIYPEKEEKNSTLTWVLFGLSIGSLVLGDSLSSLISIAIAVFTTMAYYKIYKYIVPEAVTKYTVLSFFFGGLPIYLNKNIIKPKEEKNISEADIVKEEKINKKEEEKKEEKETTKLNFCSSCGSKLAPNVKFCANCGNKVN